jgi:hypothetical protein
MTFKLQLTTLRLERRRVCPLAFKLALCCRRQMTIALRAGGEQMNYFGQADDAQGPAAR